MKRMFKKISGEITNIGMATAGMVMTASAHATALGDMASNGTTQATNVLTFGQAIGALIGLALIIGGILAIRAANKSEGQQVKYSVGIVGIICGCLLFYLSSVVQTGGDTLWSGGGSRSNLTISQ
jgi:uncharacterized membrane protein HdeD (DUF308 family)